MTTAPLTLFLTRPAPQAADFARAFAARHPDVAIFHAPLMEIRALPLPAPGSGDDPSWGTRPENRPPEESALLITSRSALDVLPDWAAGRDLWCVGERTARIAAERGLVPLGWAEDAAGLLALLGARRPAVPLLHLAGRHRAMDLAGALRGIGLRAETCVIYEQRALPLGPEALDLLGGAAPLLLPLFSPRSARLLGQAAPGIRAPLHLAAMSPAVAAAWTGPAPAAREIAPAPTADGMLAALAALMGKADPPDARSPPHGGTGPT